MIQLEKIFENLFADSAITDTRFANFSGIHLKRLQERNTGGDYDDIISIVSKPYTIFQDEVDSVQSAFRTQKGKTLTLNQFVSLFKKTISDKEGVIADLLGGRNTAAYLEFFSNGLTEYSAATKTQLPSLIKTVDTFAAKYATELGAPLTATLQSFYKGWTENRDAQSKQKSAVSDKRAGRTAARTNMELAMTISVHLIGAKFPGNSVECSTFYDTTLLFTSKARKMKELINGTAPAGSTVEALNRSFTAADDLKVINNSNNASLFVYTSSTAKGERGVQGREVKAGKSINVKIADLGDPGNTYLMIRNLSDSNDLPFVIEVRS